jgi:hypothetical protein
MPKVVEHAIERRFMQIWKSQIANIGRTFRTTADGNMMNDPLVFPGGRASNIETGTRTAQALGI